MGKMTDEQKKLALLRIKEGYKTAKKEKGEDRVTGEDIEIGLGMNKAKRNLQDIYRDRAKVKPAGAVLGILAMGALGAKALSKAKKKSSTVSSDDVKYTLKDKNMVTDLYQKATKQETAKMNMGGEVEVMKGGDYIKDLID